LNSGECHAEWGELSRRGQRDDLSAHTSGSCVYRQHANRRPAPGFVIRPNRAGVEQQNAISHFVDRVV